MTGAEATATPARLLLAGCGKMGGALLTGWVASGLAGQVVVVEPSGAASVPAGVTLVRGVEAIPEDFSPDVVVLAVKPQIMAATVPAYARFARHGAAFLSIAAGRTLDWLSDCVGDAALVRAMPNLPASIGRGMTVACANARVTATRRRLCERLLEAVGTVAWVEDEGLLDAVTAVSGGGPAYVFLLIETLARAAVAAGLPADLAMTLARSTVCGSGELAWRSAESAETLRRHVSSPGGTTLAALEILMARDGIQPLFDRAVAAAAARSRALAQD
jgi:pyrroline-5-carboxylate reductase